MTFSCNRLESLNILCFHQFLWLANRMETRI